jgi:hypothetical protein
MEEKNSASTKKKILLALLKSAYFISGFILALAISYCRPAGFYVNSNTIKATDLLERRQGGFIKNSKGAYIFNGVDI